MLNSKSFLAVDFGAGSLKLAEFEQNEAGGLRLKQYGVKPLGIEGSQEQTREAAILKALQELLAERPYGSRQVNVCAPGFHVFSKFVKLPPVDTSKVTQIIRYEAQQNVPFPLDEVVWDYQILGASATNELEVLLVAVKTEIIEGLFRVGDGAGLKIKLVDASPAALCNAFRYNYGDLEGCTMLLDIGAKTSNLLFFEKGKVFSRSINIGANSITQDFGNEAKLKFAEAEAIKIEKGSVSLGGAYEEPEDPQAAAISKISRQVMTRLHIQINQTIQFFRGQQGGSAPQRLFLSGGASIMPFTAQFFAEKINVPVEYFNPFRSIEIDPSLDLEDLSKYAHSFGEVVGLGLRDLAHCPVELNLMPKSSIQRAEFAQKKAFLIVSVYAAALGVFFAYKVETKAGDLWRSKVDAVTQLQTPLKNADEKLTAAVAKRQAEAGQIEAMQKVAENRFYWITVLGDLRDALIRAEANEKAALTTPENNGTNTDVGVWVQQFAPIPPEGSAAAAAGPSFSGNALLQRRRRGMETPPPPVATTPTAPAAPAGTISTVNITFRAVKRTKSEDADFAYKVLQCVTNTPSFGEGSRLSPTITDSPDDTNTVTFSMTAQLKRPIKL